MSNVDAKKLEEYQLVLLKNPRSKVFSALAEAYRKMDLLDEALETSQKGILAHPEYVSGLVAHSKILYQLKRYSEALPHLEKSVALKPENLLANRLLAHCYMKLKQHSKALESYKKLLFFNPNDDKASRYVKKWEFLEGKNFEFETLPINPDDYETWVNSLPAGENLLNVVDVCIAKGQFSEAKDLIFHGQNRWPMDPEISRRLNVIQHLNQKTQNLHDRKLYWEKVLQRIESRKLDPLRSL